MINELAQRFLVSFHRQSLSEVKSLDHQKPLRVAAGRYAQAKIHSVERFAAHQMEN